MVKKDNNAKKSSVIGRFSGKCCDSNVFNNNDMHLSRELFEKLIASDEFKRAMANKHYIGFLGHPADSDCQDYEHACIVMTDLKIEEDGQITGDFDLIDTPVGRVVKAFIDAGVNFGISIRGVGEVDNNGEVDPDEFIFRGFDLVTFPAYDDCIPQFKEIAASTDTTKRAAYKKICASIDANLKNINSCEALQVIQSQFPDNSDEFNKIQSRIEEINTENEQAIVTSVNEQKLKAVTELYLDAVAKVHELEAALADCQVAKDQLVVQCTSLKHRQQRLDKIVAHQIAKANSEVHKANVRNVKCNSELNALKAELFANRKDIRSMSKELSEAQQSYDQQVRANTKLKQQLDDITNKRKDDLEAVKASKNLNLKYQRKIEANSQAISQKDSEIEELKSRLNETVAASNKLESKASNLDDKNGELLSRVEAAEEMVSSYQQAYANMYANALGIYLTGLPVTATTTVEELRQMISGSTSTAGIPAKPSFYAIENEGDDEEYISEEDNDDNSQYSAGLVTL